MKVWIPMFVWREQGRLRYETHGCFDRMVSNKEKRKQVEFDFFSCFLSEADHEPERRYAKLHWISIPLSTLLERGFAGADLLVSDANIHPCEHSNCEGHPNDKEKCE